MKKCDKYTSGELHDTEQANKYSQTLKSPHRFLAYRDFYSLIERFGNINKVLDFGSGTGISTHFLFEKKYDVIGIDRSPYMIKEAKSCFPEITFLQPEELPRSPIFDLVFSSFVLFELKSKQEILNYLNFAASVLKDKGIFLGITGSEKLYQRKRNWRCFNVDYKENHNLHSGSVVKLGLKEPKMEFYDYYWKEADYKQCFQDSNLEIVQIHYPLGYHLEPFDWGEELSVSPFVIFLAQKLK